MERYTKILGTVALFAMNCSTRGTGAILPDPDAGMMLPDVPVMMMFPDSGTATDRPVTPMTDAMTPMTDATMPRTDSGIPPTDRPMTGTDRPMTRTDSGGGGFGTCGAATVGCLCTAGMEAAAQARCFGANETCAQCFSEAIGTCCPTQIQAFQDCATARMCMDQACAMTMCMSQYNAVGACFQTAQMSNAMCRAALSACFGSFPFMCE